ncbi:DNA polymerase sliding clamp [Haloarcula sp. 1CSR25-25]|uniref:DNA polymerase sliding clamp n=1 Tax=Haloarcula sp. 1CSR25-25 TaxID=2862545 RepID=UPI0037C0EFC4
MYDLRETPAHFEASIELSRLESVFKTVNRLVDEAKLRIGDDQIAIRAVDPANVGMVDLDMSTRAFQSYQADPGVIGINLSRMVDVLSVGSSDDTVHLDLDVASRKLTVTVDGLEYTLALIDPDSIRQEPTIPDLQLEGEIEMQASVLDRGVTASDMVSDHMGLAYSRNGASIHADGDTDDVDLDLTSVDGVESIKASGEGDSLFSLDYLKKINQMIPKGETARIEIGDDFPIKIYFGVADSHAEVETLLAPRIQAD